MIDAFGWVHCPICHNKTKTKMDADTVLRNFPLFCPRCKQETRIDVEAGKVRLCAETKT